MFSACSKRTAADNDLPTSTSDTMNSSSKSQEVDKASAPNTNIASATSDKQTNGVGTYYINEDNKPQSNQFFFGSYENLESLKSSGKLPEDSVIVCQEKALKDKLGEDEPGFHHYIEVDGNKRVYHSYNDMTGTGYFESFIWEKNKGLESYRSGFGSDNGLIDLQIK